MNKIRYGVILLIVMSFFTLTSCKSEEVFRDYSKTESYNSSAEIVDTTDLTEIVTATNDAELVDFTPIVSAGKTTSITLKLEKHTEYRIEVEYSSGISQSKSLVPKTSDENGYITWAWQVGAKCKAGKYPVRIYKGTKLVFETRLNIG